MKDTTKTRQCETALEKANRLRIARSGLLKDLSGNEISLEEMFETEDAAGIRLVRILGALPHRPRKVGGDGIRHSTASAIEIANRAGISLDREIGSVNCPVMKTRILNAAFDVVGRFSWVFSNDHPPKLKERRKSRTLGAHDLAHRNAALAKATGIRTRRKELKQKLRAGEISLADVLADDASGSWPIGKLVIHAPRIHPVTGKTVDGCGPSRAHIALRRARIAPTRKVSDLSDREKDALLCELTVTLTLATGRRRADQVPA